MCRCDPVDGGDAAREVAHPATPMRGADRGRFVISWKVSNQIRRPSARKLLVDDRSTQTLNNVSDCGRLINPFSTDACASGAASGGRDFFLDLSVTMAYWSAASGRPRPASPVTQIYQAEVIR